MARICSYGGLEFLALRYPVAAAAVALVLTALVVLSAATIPRFVRLSRRLCITGKGGSWRRVKSRKSPFPQPKVPKPAAPLRVSSGFREFVLGQLAGVRGLHARPMFGGIGLYGGGAFFGIVASDVLYLKVNDESRQDFERAGARPFKPYANRPVTMRYYSVPAEIVEDADSVTQWARRSIEVALTDTLSTRRSGRRTRGVPRRRR